MAHRFVEVVAFVCFCLWAVASAASDLLVLDYEGYEHQEYHSDFFEKHLKNPSFVTYTDSDKAFHDVSAGLQADVIHLCSSHLDKWIDAGLIERWGPNGSVRTGFGTHDIKLSASAVERQDYLAPFVFGRTLPIYDSTSVPKEDVESLEVFIDPNYRGSIALPADPVELFGLSLLATGVDDWTTLSEGQISAALEWLRKAQANTPQYWTSYSVLSEQMARGEIIVAWAWSEVGFLAQKINPAIRFVHEPKEGTSAWTCGYAKPTRRGADLQVIHDFVASRTSPKLIDILLAWGEGHPDAAVMRSRLTVEEIQDRGLAIPEGPVLFLSPLPTQLLNRIVDEVSRIRNVL